MEAARIVSSFSPAGITLASRDGVGRAYGHTPLQGGRGLRPDPPEEDGSQWQIGGEGHERGGHDTLWPYGATGGRGFEGVWPYTPTGDEGRRRGERMPCGLTGTTRGDDTPSPTGSEIAAPPRRMGRNGTLDPGFRRDDGRRCTGLRKAWARHAVHLRRCERDEGVWPRPAEQRNDITDNGGITLFP